MLYETTPTRGALIRDVMIFNLKLLLDGLKGVVVFQAALAAAVLDLLFPRARLFYRVLYWAEHFDLWLNLNGAGMHAGESPNGLFGFKATSDSLLGQLEALVRRRGAAA
jgi:hypothetical protein